MKPWIFALAAASACSGCTMVSLERNALAQANSSVRVRYQETLNNLALIASNPSALPTFASIYTGTVQVTDVEQIASTTAWLNLVSMNKKTGFFSEAINPQVNRTVLENWTLDPISVPEKLEAMRCACQWVVYGPGNLCPACMSLLLGPDEDPSPGRHFNVAKRLAKLPVGWLHIGRPADVPAGVSYKTRHGDTWVWVMPDGIKGLADFSLVLLDIARVDSNSPTLFNLPPSPSPLTFPTSDSPVESHPGVGPGVRPRTLYLTATVSLDQNERLVPDIPYTRVRVDNVGTDTRFRSQINAAGATPGATTPATTPR